MSVTTMLIGGAVLAVAFFTWALCAAAKRGDELMADMQRARDFTRRETEVRP